MKRNTTDMEARILGLASVAGFLGLVAYFVA